MKTAARIATTAALVGLGLLGLVVSSGAVDRTPPTLAVEAKTRTAVSGTLPFTLAVEDDAPGVGGWSASLDGTPAAITVDDDGGLSVSLAGLQDGSHTLEIAAWDSAWKPNWAHTTLSFAVDQTAPTLRIATRSLEAAQGRAHPVLVESNEPLSPLSGRLGTEELTFFPLDEDQTRWRALVGVPIEAETGPRTLALEAEDRAGNAVSASHDLAVRATRFSRGGTIQLRPEQVAVRQDEAATAKTRTERDTAHSWDHPEQLWDGPFLRPVDGGRLSSAFGRYRTYSDGKKDRHTSTDIAAPIGTPVVAAAAGEVRFAGEQARFGQVVIVHHGQGLSTSYNHLSDISVEPGQRVAQGETVGAVGSTGQSTGPHLDWGVVVAQTPVDGMLLLTEALDILPDEAWTPLDALTTPR